MAVNPNEPIIDDDAADDFLFNFKVNGDPVALGCVERDYTIQPAEMLAAPSDIPIIPKSEWSARIKEQEERKSRTSDVMKRAGVPCLFQNGFNFCWCYSSTTAVLAVRALNGQPFVDLNPQCVGSLVMKDANRGGWSALSAQFIRDNGVCSTEFWPKLKVGYRKYDTPEMRANMALHKITEDFVDMSARNAWDRNLSFEQFASCLLQNIPVAIDLMWWRHAVVALDLVEVEPGDFGIRIRNSHGETWGDDGYGVIRGSKAVPDGAVGVRTTPGANK